MPSEYAPMEEEYFPGTSGMATQSLLRMEETKRAQMDGLIINIFTPMLFFVIVEAVFTFCGNNSVLCGLLVVVFAGISVLFMCVPVAPEKPTQTRKFYLILGVICFFTTIIASLFGWYNWTRNMSRDAAHNGQRTYNNVLPTEPALAHLDAGKIVFSPDSKLNLNFAVGYKDGSMYCVAPIIDATGNSQNKGQFFAAGQDCCEARGGFTCDDYNDPKAHSGLVYLKFDDYEPLDKFRLAAHEVAATHGVTVSEDAIFVKWVRDADTASDAYKNAGMSFFVGTSLVYAVLCVMAGLAVHLNQRRAKRP